MSSRVAIPSMEDASTAAAFTSLSSRSTEEDDDEDVEESTSDAAGVGGVLARRGGLDLDRSMLSEEPRRILGVFILVRLNPPMIMILIFGVLVCLVLCRKYFILMRGLLCDNSMLTSQLFYVRPE